MAWKIDDDLIVRQRVRLYDGCRYVRLWKASRAVDAVGRAALCRRRWHGMIFQRFDGQLMMVLHQPNKVGFVRARLFELEDTGDTLHIKVDFPTPASLTSSTPTH